MLRYLIAILIFAAGCRITSSGTMRMDPALETLIPADTTFIAFANIDKIRETAIYQKYADQADLLAMNDFVKHAGIDARKDLWQILLCSNGKATLLMARGKFSAGELEPKLEGLRRFGYKGFTLFGTEERAILFVNSSTAVDGPTLSLRALIDARDGPGRGLPAALKQQIESIPPGSQIWAAAIGGLHGFDAGIPERVLQGIDGAAVGVDFSNGLAVAAHAQCRNEEDARSVHDGLRGMIGIARLGTTKGHPELLEVYDAIQVGRKQNQVLVTAQVSPRQVDEFVGQWLKRQ